MAFRIGHVQVDIPALDRLMDYVAGEQQKEIDGLEAQVKSLTKRLTQSSADLSTATAKEK